MKKIITFALSLFLFMNTAKADDFSAKVDSTKVIAGEPFELRLTYNGTDNNIQPDLSGLQKDFQIYSNATSMQTSYINGVVNQQKTWTLGLIALKEGNINIAPIKAGNLSSESLELTVLPAGSKIENNGTNSSENAADNKVKFSADFSIDNNDVFVKQEITGTLTIKDYVGLDFVSDPVFLNADDWTIKILEQPKVSKIENGREIKVNFAMFANKSGLTEVPALQWQAVYFDMQDIPQPHRTGFFDMDNFSVLRGMQKPLIIQTKPQKIKVKPIPEEYGNAWWLPAKALTMAGKWSDENPQFKAGEAVTREVILSAAGVLDSELPELEFVAPEGIKQYPENPQFSLSVYKNMPIAQATYRIVYIPQKSGKITLPEIYLKWFNTKNNKIETAVIAAQEIEVEANPAYEETIQNEAPVAKPIIEPKADNKPEQNLHVSTTDNKQEYSFLWLIIAFGAGMFLSYLLFAGKNKNNDGGKTLNRIRKNLKNKDYRRLRDNLIKWGNENFADSAISNLNDLALVINNEDFAEQMQILNRLLYADTKEVLDYGIIVGCLKERLRNKSGKEEKSTPLPKLYE